MGDDFLDYLHELFSAFAPIRTRAMFGGHGGSAAVAGGEERIIGIVLDDALYLKTDAQTVDRFRAAGCAPFVYHGQAQPITMSYWSLPDEAMDSPQAMQPGAQLAWEAALRKPLARRKRKQ
jgi:DNA transformation protein